MKRALVLAV